VRCTSRSFSGAGGDRRACLTPNQHPPPTDPVVNEDDVKAREREKLDIGDDHPADRDTAEH